MSDQRPYLSLSGVTKRFDDLVAVNNINVDLYDGELVVILGPSGCGKSTTLRMIAGLEAVTEGSVRMKGQELTGIKPQDRDIAMVFQDYGLYPHFTVKENIRFPLKKMDLSESQKEELVQETADLLEIEGILNDKPSQISGGQQQRVALSRAIVREPDLFLLDEPLSNLDQRLRVHTRSEIRSLQKRLETTMIYVTHDQEEAMSLADRIMIMRNGEIEQIGTPENLYKKPKNEFIAGFLGDPKMNFLEMNGEYIGSVVDQLNLTVDERTQTIGFRPNDIYLSPEIQLASSENKIEPSRPVSATLNSVQPLGHRYQIELTINDSNLRAVVDNISDGINEGDGVKIFFNLSNIYQFDSIGNRITNTSTHQ